MRELFKKNDLIAFYSSKNITAIVLVSDDEFNNSSNHVAGTLIEEKDFKVTGISIGHWQINWNSTSFELLHRDEELNCDDIIIQLDKLEELWQENLK